MRGRQLFLSVLVIGEIRQGVERLRRRDPDQAQIYDEWLATLQRTYRDRVIPITVEVADRWGRMNVPDPLSTVEALMTSLVVC